MLIKKLKTIIDEIKKDIEGIAGLVPKEKQKIIKDLIIEAAMIYGRAKIQKELRKI